MKISRLKEIIKKELKKIQEQSPRGANHTLRVKRPTTRNQWIVVKSAQEAAKLTSTPLREAQRGMNEALASFRAGVGGTGPDGLPFANCNSCGESVQFGGCFGSKSCFNICLGPGCSSQ